MAYQVEYTDTFGGDANYSWVRRARVEGPREAASARSRRRAIMRQAKAAVGLTGVRGRTDVYSSDDMAFRPYGMATVLFVTWTDAEPDAGVED